MYCLLEPVAMEQGADGQDERRSLRRFRSVDASRAEALAAATATAAPHPTPPSEKRPPIGPGVRQQSDMSSMRRPVSRAGPMRAPTQSANINSSSGKRVCRDPSPVSSAKKSQIPRVPQSPQAGSMSREGSWIPRLTTSGRWVSEVERQARALVAAQEDNLQLFEELQTTAAYVKQFNEELIVERQKVTDATELARHFEAELGNERRLNAALEEKITALESLLADRAAATDPAAERFEGRESLQDTMGSVLAACAAKRSRAEFSTAARRDLSIVEAYIASDAAQTPLSARDDDARVKRRRSSMLFADLMLPSGGGPAMTSSGACERCGQLAESMQCLEADNDYYREANRKLRDAVNDTTSRHNALVRIFEVERARRREIHAAGLAEASRQATHDRMMLEVSDPLASRFERSLHIAQPST
ncbi:hypothetical protein GGI21_001014 [Coemansia aciculifera]|nr:hypothetical protein GGI21_001014 [Coemansia aciculifera]